MLITVHATLYPPEVRFIQEGDNTAIARKHSVIELTPEVLNALLNKERFEVSGEFVVMNRYDPVTNIVRASGYTRTDEATLDKLRKNDWSILPQEQPAEATTSVGG